MSNHTDQTPMSNGPNPSETNPQGSGVALPGDQRDLLISRIIDGRARGHDWDRFRDHASHDPQIWAQLGDTQRQHESLCSSLAGDLAVADRVELPGIIDDGPVRHRLDMVSRWGGWAAAAALMLVWFVGRPMTSSPDGASPSSTAGMLSIPLKEAKPDQAFDQYMSAGQQSGRVVAEMPDRVVIETRPMSDGTVEVLYLRQIVERQIIDHAYRQMQDEMGNAVTVPMELNPVQRWSY